MEKFTPGPWRVGQGSYVVADTPVSGIDGADAVSYYGGYLICESVNAPNAQLIAAAPDLLAACKPVIDERNYQSNSDEYVIVSLTIEEWRAIRAAIAKARGEEK